MRLALYHFLVAMPGKRGRARRYYVRMPSGVYVGFFWNRREAERFARTGYAPAVSVLGYVPKARRVGWLEAEAFTAASKEK